MESSFAFTTCQVGAENALKQEVEARLSGWKFAFSRPGFVTFKLSKPTTVDRFEPPKLTFARTIGLSYERISGLDQMGELAQAVATHPATVALAERGPLRLHVWQRDTALPGEDGIEPGPTPLSDAAYEAILATAPELFAFAATDKPEDSAADTKPDANKKTRRPPAVALDVVMVDPTEWWIGAHVIRSRTDRWAGGVPKLTLPEHAVTRAYLKMQEALRWSAFPISKGEHWIELGCAPGGASQALLDAGMLVTGVDPADIDEALVTERRFRHIQMRSAEAPHSEFVGANWLAADINAAPSYTLDAAEEIAVKPEAHIRGLLLTLKLLSHHLAEPEQILACIERVRSWGFADVRVRQLAFNRREYCLAALRTRSQRRLSRRPVSRRKPTPKRPPS